MSVGLPEAPGPLMPVTVSGQLLQESLGLTRQQAGQAKPRGKRGFLTNRLLFCAGQGHAGANIHTAPDAIMLLRQILLK